MSFTAAAFGGTWVSVTPSGGTTPGTVSISVDPTGLASGTYSATIKLTPRGSASLNIPVILTVFSADDGGGEGEADDGGGASGDSALRASPYAYDPAGTNSVAAKTGSMRQERPRRPQRTLVCRACCFRGTSAASSEAKAVVVIRNAEGITLTALGYDSGAGRTVYREQSAFRDRHPAMTSSTRSGAILARISQRPHPDGIVSI